MNKEILTITSNRPVANGIWEMILDGCSTCRPGQFVELSLEGLFLRRPISVSNWKDGKLTLLYKVVGKGTAQMTGLVPGDRIDALTALGNGFDLDACDGEALLVGGGIGNAPLFMLAESLLESGRKVVIVCGYRSSGEILDMSSLEAKGAKVLIATEDGSAGTKGFVTTAIAENGINPSYYYACGPMPMLRALAGAADCPGELSLEERMGCGFGICMGCTIPTASGPRRVCKDGPIFKKDQLTW